MGTDKDVEPNGLLPLRSDVVHNGLIIPKEEKRALVDYISAGRRFVYRLINWIKSEPEDNIAPPLRKKKHRIKPKTR